MAEIESGLDHNDDDGQRWIAENMQGLYQVRAAPRAVLCRAEHVKCPGPWALSARCTADAIFP